jgi:TPR repeat protein
VIARGLRSAAGTFDAHCRRGEADSCFQLANMLEAGTGIRRDVARAAKLYETACTGGVRHGCLEAGRLYDKGLPAADRDAPRAARLLRKACTSSLDDACVAYAHMLEVGDGVPRDTQRARFHFSALCRDGNAVACHGAGRVAEDPEEAVKLFERACDAGAGAACKSLADVVEAGKGTRRDAARALALYERACSAGDRSACHLAGLMHDLGIGCDADAEEAARWYAREQP